MQPMCMVAQDSSCDYSRMVWKWSRNVCQSMIDSINCHIKIIFSSPKNLLEPTKKPWLSGLALAFRNSKLGQSHHEAVFMAWLGLAYLGSAWPGSQLQAGASTALTASCEPVHGPSVQLIWQIGEIWSSVQTSHYMDLTLWHVLYRSVMFHSTYFGLSDTKPENPW